MTSSLLSCHLLSWEPYSSGLELLAGEANSGRGLMGLPVLASLASLLEVGIQMGLGQHAGRKTYLLPIPGVPAPFQVHHPSTQLQAGGGREGW